MTKPSNHYENFTSKKDSSSYYQSKSDLGQYYNSRYDSSTPHKYGYKSYPRSEGSSYYESKSPKYESSPRYDPSYSHFSSRQGSSSSSTYTPTRYNSHYDSYQESTKTSRDASPYPFEPPISSESLTSKEQQALNDSNEYSISAPTTPTSPPRDEEPYETSDDVTQIIEVKPEQDFSNLTKTELLMLIDEKEELVTQLTNDKDHLLNEKERLLRELENPNKLKSKAEIKQRIRLSMLKRTDNPEIVFVEDKETFFKPTKALKEPKEYELYQNNLKRHDEIKDKILKVMQQRLKDLRDFTLVHTKHYIKLKSSWKKALRQKAEEEATQQLFASKSWQVQQQFGWRKFPVRSSRFDEDSKKSKKGDEYIDYERFDNNQADIPCMLVFNPRRDFEKYQFITNNTRVEKPLLVEKEYKQDYPWFKEEEELFLKLYLRYQKDFTAIASFLPAKTTKDVIWFYYNKKYKLDLKKKVQNLKESPTEESLLQQHMLGTTIDWVNGSSRRGSIRLSEKTQVSYIDANNTEAVVSPPLSAKKSRKSRMDDNFTTESNDSTDNNGKKSKTKQSVAIGSGSVDVPAKTKSHWTEDEKVQFKQHLSTYGKDWNQIAEYITTKSTSQIKNYFQNYRVKLKLDELLPEGERSKRRTTKKVKRGRPKNAKGEEGDSVEEAL